MKNRIVFVFDLDGTLIDSVELHAKAFKYAVKTLGYKNYNELYKKFKKFIGRSLEDIVKTIIKGIDEKEIKKIRKLKDEYVLKNLGKIKLKKRVVKILMYIKSLNFPVALFTSSTKEFTYKVLKKFGLEKYFDYIITKEDVKKHKPNPEGLIKISKKFRTKNVVFIGDSKFDKIAAKKAKFKFIEVKNLKMKKIKELISKHLKNI